MKVCVDCKELKPALEFTKRSDAKDGLDFRCKPCMAAKRKRYMELHPEQREKNINRLRQWRVANPEKSRESSARWKENNLEATIQYGKEWYINNKEHIKQRTKAYRENNRDKVLASKRATYYKYIDKNKHNQKIWAQKNKDKVVARARRYELSKINRTPKWLTADDTWLIQEAYHLAQVRKDLTGIKWHVDHILPLRGELVSGLHVPSNLQVIPASENMRKRNKYAV